LVARSAAGDEGGLLAQVDGAVVGADRQLQPVPADSSASRWTLTVLTPTEN
jgi:hypothetical protein